MVVAGLTLSTDRLLLRPMEERDRSAFCAMNADPEVMRYFVAPLTHAESDEVMERYEQNLVVEGFGFLAAEETATGVFAGILGMQTMSFAVPGLAQPAVEIGWRLARAAQGRGLASEGAQALVDHAFKTLDLPGVVAVTLPINRPSRRVMQKLGMRHRPELTFIHPRIPEQHPYQQHVLYSLENRAHRTLTENALPA